MPCRHPVGELPHQLLQDGSGSVQVPQIEGEDPGLRTGDQGAYALAQLFWPAVDQQRDGHRRVRGPRLLDLGGGDDGLVEPGNRQAGIPEQLGGDHPLGMAVEIVRPADQLGALGPRLGCRLGLGDPLRVQGSEPPGVPSRIRSLGDLSGIGRFVPSPDRVFGAGARGGTRPRTGTVPRRGALAPPGSRGVLGQGTERGPHLEGRYGDELEADRGVLDEPALSPDLVTERVGHGMVVLGSRSGPPLGQVGHVR